MEIAQKILYWKENNYNLIKSENDKRGKILYLRKEFNNKKTINYDGKVDKVSKTEIVNDVDEDIITKEHVT